MYFFNEPGTTIAAGKVRIMGIENTWERNSGSKLVIMWKKCPNAGLPVGRTNL